MRLHNRMQSVAVATLFVAFVFGSTRAVNAQIMLRGSASGSQGTCPISDGPQKREFLFEGNIGTHTEFLELSFGGIASNCPESEVLGNFGVVVFPLHIGRFYAGGGAHYDFNATRTKRFLRPEAVVGFTLKRKERTRLKSTGERVHDEMGGLAIDLRAGRYEDRALYVSAGIAYYFILWK